MVGPSCSDSGSGTQSQETPAEVTLASELASGILGTEKPRNQTRLSSITDNINTQK